MLNSNCRYQASYGEEEVNLLRQEVSNLKARLQRTGTPHRESPGVGAGADEQVIKFDHRVCGIFGCIGIFNSKFSSAEEEYELDEEYD